MIFNVTAKFRHLFADALVIQLSINISGGYIVPLLRAIFVKEKRGNYYVRTIIRKLRGSEE